MQMSLICMPLEKFDLRDAFIINLDENNSLKVEQVMELRITHIKSLIWIKKKDTLGDIVHDSIKLWKVNIALNDVGKLEGVTEEQIKSELKGVELISIFKLEKYFENSELKDDTKISIIVQFPVANDYPNKRLRLDFDFDIDLGRPPTPLLRTNGLSWDYQESPELEKKLRKYVRRLYDAFKEDRRDKSNTPMFYMVSGTGCGKSRNATELPKTLRKIFANDPELGPRLLEALIFNISLESDTRLNPFEESDANVAVAKRMLYQLQSQGLHWCQIRDDMQDLSIFNILMSCAKQKKVVLKELTVIFIVDGLQTALINQNEGINESFSRSLVEEISVLALNNDSPLVIACCTSALSRQVDETRTVSHQSRIFLPIRSLNPPKKKGMPIFKDIPLLNMLVNDMGGNGRALEALESALKDVDFENTSFVTIAEQIYYELKNRYSGWISHTRYLIPVLRAILAHTTLVVSKPIPGTDILPEEIVNLGLVKFVKRDEFSNIGTLTCPYIWLWLMANVSVDDSILQNWNFKYYQEIQINDGDPSIPPGCQFWQHFEHFIASFRVLKSKVFDSDSDSDSDKEIELQVIHTGAKHNFGEATIKNIPLSLEKAIGQESTKSSAYSANKTVTCKKADNQINLNLEDASACIINGTSATFGDSFCPIHLTNPSRLCIESHRKLLNSNVNQTIFDTEYEKAADKGDVFILYTRGSSNVNNLPLLSAIVDRECWSSYFGPFAGRAFLLLQNDKFNANNCSISELTSIHGIDVKRAKLLVLNRPYKNLDDCYEKTRICRIILENFRFDPI